MISPGKVGMAVTAPGFPRVEKGQVVWWYVNREPDDRLRPAVGVIERVSSAERGLCDVLLLSRGQIARKNGCRWIDDPSRAPDANDGFYDLTDRDRRVERLLETAPRLMEMLEDYEAQGPVEVESGAEA